MARRWMFPRYQPRSWGTILLTFALIVGPWVGNFFLSLAMGLTFDNPWYLLFLLWCLVTGIVSGILATLVYD